MSFYVLRLSGCRDCRALVGFWGLGGGKVGLVVDLFRVGRMQETECPDFRFSEVGISALIMYIKTHFIIYLF